MKIISYKLFFRAISNETRLAIINLLRVGPKNVSELSKKLGFEQSRVSHNLKCLVDCGFVNAKQEGKNRIYFLDNKTIKPMLDLIDKHIEKYHSYLCKCGIMKEGKR